MLCNPGTSSGKRDEPLEFVFHLRHQVSLFVHLTGLSGRVGTGHIPFGWLPSSLRLLGMVPGPSGLLYQASIGGWLRDADDLPLQLWRRPGWGGGWGSITPGSVVETNP